jgi:hypothetical protein
MHWNGTTWTVVASPDLPGARLEGVVALSPSDAWAVGSDSLIEHWDGRAWSVVPNPASGHLMAIDAAAANDLWAVGYDAAGPLVEHWNGSVWKVVPVPSAPAVSEFTDVVAVSASDVHLVGFGFDASQNASYRILAHWNGAGFTLTRVSDGVGALAARGAGDVWAGSSDVVHWDGASWTPVPLPYLENPPYDNAGFLDLDVSAAGTVWAAGRNQGNRGVIARLCPVAVRDAGFTPASATVAYQGSTVAWSFPQANGQAHAIRDANGLGLFDSGPRAPGSSFTTKLIAAGSYAVLDSASGATSTVKMRLKLAPPWWDDYKDTVDPNEVTLVWASEWGGPNAGPPWAPGAIVTTLPTGYACDVQVKRPGTTSFVYWRKRTRETYGSFLADAGSGVYAFRARYRNTQNYAASGWSPILTVTIP